MIGGLFAHPVRWVQSRTRSVDGQEPGPDNRVPIVLLWEDQRDGCRQ